MINRSLSSLTLVVALASCKATSPVTENNGLSNLPSSILSSDSTAIFTQSRLNGHKAIQLDDTRYIANSENLGLFVFDKQQNVIAATTGNYEGLDVRTIDGITYVISINKELGQTEIYSFQQASFKLEQSVKLRQTRVSNVCFYQPSNQELQALLLTEDFRLEQRLVLDDLGHASDLRLIRQLPAPPHSSACAASDQQNELYIAEETNGIWRYPLNPEDEIQRQAIAMTKPFGRLEGEIKDLSILDDGRLLASMPDMSSVLLFEKQTESWSIEQVSLPEDSIPESASLTTGGELVWFDKETDSYNSQHLSLPIAKVMAKKNSIISVTAHGQTAPVNHFGDAADDPAIWPNKANPELSLILGTDKSAGLYVYNLKGETQQFIATGRVNNVDISFGFNWQGKQVDLAAASNRTINAIALYSIDINGKVAEIGSIPTDLPDVYGLCSYKSKKTNKHYVFINDENGTFQQYEISAESGKLAGKMVRQFSVPSQPEGCVADADSATLFLGEEGKGVWTVGAEPHKMNLELAIEIDEHVLFDDVEGLSIYKGETKDYLVVSSQGNNSYVLYDLMDLSLVGNFRVKANYQTGIDGTSETDGLAVSSFNFGGVYQSGLLVVQDGRNVMPSKPQNFKLISWKEISQKLALVD